MADEKIPQEVHDALSKCLNAMDRRVAELEKSLKTPTAKKQADEVCDCYMCRAISEMRREGSR